jgi:hypothetical protein
VYSERLEMKDASLWHQNTSCVSLLNFEPLAVLSHISLQAGKDAFNKKRALGTSKMDLELRKKLVKCYIWSIALYGAETWTFRAVDQKHLESFEM